MTSLESVVLPLAESRSLVEHGIVLDTAMVWWHVPSCEPSKQYQVQTSTCDYYASADIVCPAPTLSELLDAIRERVGNPLEERTIILSQDGHLEVSCCAGVRSPHGKYQIAYNDTDLLAACALLLEVAK